MILDDCRHALEAANSMLKAMYGEFEDVREIVLMKNPDPSKKVGDQFEDEWIRNLNPPSDYEQIWVGGLGDVRKDSLPGKYATGELVMGTKAFNALMIHFLVDEVTEHRSAGRLDDAIQAAVRLGQESQKLVWSGLRSKAKTRIEQERRSAKSDKYSERRDSVVKAMKPGHDEHNNVRRAAKEAYENGVGQSVEANERAWYRAKKNGEV